MKHLFRATKIGQEKEQEGILFESDYDTEEEARKQCKPYDGVTQKRYDYTRYEYDAKDTMI